VKSRTGVLKAARQRLEKSSIPVEDQEVLLNLLNLMVSTLEDTEGPIEESEIVRLADALADNSHLMNLINHQAAELDALRRITLNLTSSLDLQAVLDTVVSEAMRLVKDAHDAIIFLYQDEQLQFGASLNVDGTKNVFHHAPRPTGLTSTVARNKKMTIVEDMQRDPLFVDANGSQTGSIVSLPLLIGSRVVGVMNLGRERSGEFSLSEIRLLNMLADQAAIAILNARLHAAVTRQALSDTLTGLPNRRALDERLEEEITRSNRSGRSFSVIMMDLDNFKKVNDSYGHDVGDVVLQRIAACLVQTVRTADFLARYGGDEMTLILSESNLVQAKVVVHKIEENLRNLIISMPDGKTTTLSVSGGIALYPEHADTASGLIRAADGALYQAKKNGPGKFNVAHNST
jgi:two-component system cell cycle response regulator